MDNNKVGWFHTYIGSWLETRVCNLLKCGQIPKHIAFIMDGNRRYADKTNIAKSDGHKSGFNTLSKVLSWCKEFGITQVTLYAFSIENFKRTRDEVDSIMDLAREKCDSLLDELDRVNEDGIKVRVAGDLHLLPADLRMKIEKIQKMTCNNDKALLNICLAYTSRHEIVATIKKLSQDKPDNLNLELFEQNLYLPRPFPDLIIRTSGEVRLSDFMLWQCQESTLIFVNVLWPEITIWHLMKAIFHFQYQKKFVQKVAQRDQ